jgi:hypothetical protein
MAKNKKRAPSRPKAIKYAAPILVVIVAVGLVVWHDHSNKPAAVKLATPASSTTKAAGSTSSTINYGPPTTAEQAESDAANSIGRAAQNNQTTNPTNTTINPVIVTDSQNSPGQSLNVTSYVNGVIENGGTCTLTLTKSGSQTITQSGSGSADASYTDCPAFTVPFSKFNNQTGNWQLTLSYSSSSASGSTSVTKQIE